MSVLSYLSEMLSAGILLGVMRIADNLKMDFVSSKFMARSRFLSFLKISEGEKYKLALINFGRKLKKRKRGYWLKSSTEVFPIFFCSSSQNVGRSHVSSALEFRCRSVFGWKFWASWKSKLKIFFCWMGLLLQYRKVLSFPASSFELYMKCKQSRPLIKIWGQILTETEEKYGAGRLGMGWLLKIEF